MGKSLVAYFSASGVTKKLAGVLAEAANADIYEIKPAVAYTKEDLNWMDKASRSSVEMANPASRPEIEGTCDEIAQCDTLFVGFPIWWYTAPTIIKTFLESYDLSGKKIVLFATSGGSDMGKTAEDLAGSCPGAEINGGKVLSAAASKEELRAWVQGLEV